LSLHLLIGSGLVKEEEKGGYSVLSWVGVITKTRVTAIRTREITYKFGEGPGTWWCTYLGDQRK